MWLTEPGSSLFNTYRQTYQEDGYLFILMFNSVAETSFHIYSDNLIIRYLFGMSSLFFIFSSLSKLLSVILVKEWGQVGFLKYTFCNRISIKTSQPTNLLIIAPNSDAFTENVTTKPRCKSKPVKFDLFLLYFQSHTWRLSTTTSLEVHRAEKLHEWIPPAVLAVLDTTVTHLRWDVFV